MNRRMEPPENYRPDPRCVECGSLDVVQEALEDGAELCEEHDSRIARDRVRLEERLHQLGEKAADLSQRMHRDMDQDESERLRDRKARNAEEMGRIRKQLRELREEKCGHENANITADVFTKDDLESVPEDEWPDETPTWHWSIHCPECGLSDQWSPDW